MIRLVPRTETSALWQIATPVMAVVATMRPPVAANG